MKHRISFLLLVVGGLSLALLFWSSPRVEAEPVTYKKPIETAKFLSGTNSVKAVSNCLICHSADYVSSQPPLSRTAWKSIVVKMQKVHGAPILDSEVDPIVDYLVRTYGTEKEPGKK